MNGHRAFFLTLEGIEGSGKTTVLQRVQDRLRTDGYRVLMTREPGGTEIGDQIRRILLLPENKAITPETELLLYAAARAQHITQVIKPALQDYDCILCDRFHASTLSYQGYARGLPTDIIQNIILFASDNLKPDLSIILDISPEKGLSRADRRVASSPELNCESRFEMESIAFHKKVRDGFLEIAKQNTEDYRVIDASVDMHEVVNKVLEIIQPFLKRS